MCENCDKIVVEAKAEATKAVEDVAEELFVLNENPSVEDYARMVENLCQTVKKVLASEALSEMLEQKHEQAKRMEELLDGLPQVPIAALTLDEDADKKLH